MIGQLLDRRYRIVKVLGSNAVGKTYLAADTHRPGYPQCVVKHLQPPSNNPRTVQIIELLFQKKAAMLEKLGKHDRIPQLLAFFEEQGQFYLVEEFIAGLPLATEMMPGVPLSEEQVFRILQEVLEILVFVHQNGAIHGDLQPAHLIRRSSDGKLVLIQFGAIQEITSQIPSSKIKPSPSSSSKVVTSPYKPIEILQSNATYNSDIYALGLIAIQALTGLDIETLTKRQDSDKSSEAKLLWRHRAQVSAELADILEQMVCYDYNERYQTASEVLMDLKTIDNLSEEDSPVSPVSIYREKNYFKSRYRLRLKQVFFAKKHLIIGFSVLILGGIVSWIGTHKMQHQTAGLKSSGLEKSERGDRRGAIEDYNQAIALNPGDAEAYYKRGNANYDLQNWQQSIEDYSQSIRLKPDRSDSYYNRGLAYYALQQYQQALEDFTQAISLNPNDGEAYYKRGLVYFNIKEYSKAIEDYTETIRRNPNDGNAYISRGLARSAAQDKKGAIADYTLAIRINPNNAEAYYSRGRARFFLADYQGSMEDYTEAIRINPKYGDAYSNRCGTQLNLGQYQKAVEDCTQAITFNKSDNVAYENRCVAYFNLREYEKSIEDCTTGLSLNSNNTQAYNNRGLARAAAGDKAAAIEDFTKAIRLNPSDSIAYSNRAGVYEDLGDNGKAIEDYTQAIRLKPDHNRAYYGRAALRAQLGDKSGAIEDFQKSSKLCLDQGNTACYNDALYQIKKLQ